MKPLDALRWMDGFARHATRVGKCRSDPIGLENASLSTRCVDLWLKSIDHNVPYCNVF